MRKQTNTIIIVVSLLAASLFTLTSAKLIMKPNEVIDIVTGLVEGVTKSGDLEELQGCISDTEFLTYNIEKSVNELRKGGVGGVTSAIMSMKELIENIPQSLDRCVKLGSDINKFRRWANIFSKPVELA